MNGRSEKDADALAGLGDEVPQLIHEQHGYMRLPAPCFQVHNDVLLHRPLAELQLVPTKPKITHQPNQRTPPNEEDDDDENR